MVSQRWNICLAILMLGLFTGACAADGPPFPKMSDLEVLFYEAQVQVVDIAQGVPAQVTEVYDDSVPRGALHIVALGERRSFFYNKEADEIIEVTPNSCKVWQTTESEIYYVPIFYGWLNKSPLRIGPTAPLWFAQDRIDQIEYIGQKKMRGILCDGYKLEISEITDNVTYYYFFAVKDWVTPFKFPGLRVPIRIQVQGKSSKGVDDSLPEDTNILTEFAYFRPSISDWSNLQPPQGIGCMLRKPTLTIPKIQNTFRYSAEFFDILKGKNKSDPDIESHEVWYDGRKKLARLDRFMKQRNVMELYDFNTGVTYSILNDNTCVIKPLRNSFFEQYSENRLFGRMKSPEEVLNLDGDFYYLGRRSIRGLRCDVFESAARDAIYKGIKMNRLVVTMYFTQEYQEVSVNGNDETRVPVYYMVTGWNETDRILQEQYNMLAFDNMVFPKMFTTFSLEKCFPSLDDKVYFVIIIPTPEEVARAMEGQDDSIMLQMRNLIMEYAKVSEMRLPFLKADYKSSGVYVTGLMLDRPPALLQFWFELEWDAVVHDPDLKKVDGATKKEECAFACVEEDGFDCTGFFMCDNGCWLKSKDILEPNGDDKEQNVGKKCEEYLRSERDSNNKEEYIGKALLNLEDAVLNSKMKISVEMDSANKMTKIVNATDIILGEGPYTGTDDIDKAYSIVVDLAQLSSDDTTVRSMTDVTTIGQCFRNCRDSKSEVCASFSFCVDAKGDKRCRLSSTMIDDKADGIIDGDSACNIYSMKYLRFYDAYPGRVVMLTGDESFNNIPTAEECAHKCRVEKKFVCRGFEYCKKAKSCVLHSKHVLDLKPSEITAGDKNNPCTHYAAKFTVDFLDMGHVLVTDDSDKRVELTLEECARVCSEEEGKRCLSFNYCPPSSEGSADSSCSLSVKSITEKGVETNVDDKCRHYEKRKNVDDLGKPDSKVTLFNLQPPGYTSKGFTGLVVGMLALGLILGALGFVGYSYWRSRNSDSGMTIRFVKQET